MGNNMFTGEFSGLFAPMWKCPTHGEVWGIEEITEGDETFHLCSICHQIVTPLYHDGLRVMHPLTDEQAYWEQMNAEYPDRRDDPQYETPEEWLDDEDDS
jgi:hypothetical protein